MKIQKAQTIVNQHRAAQEKLGQVAIGLETAKQNAERLNAVPVQQAELLHKLTRELEQLESHRSALVEQIGALKSELYKPVAGLNAAWSLVEERRKSVKSLEQTVAKWAKNLPEAHSTLADFEVQKAQNEQAVQAVMDQVRHQATEAKQTMPAESVLRAWAEREVRKARCARGAASV